MSIPSTELLTIDAFLAAPIWAVGAAPSRRTVQDWVKHLGLPRERRGRLVWFRQADVYAFLLEKHFCCPRGRRAELLAVLRTNATPMLVTLRQLMASGVWVQSSAPSERTIRTWIAENEIPYFRIRHSLYFEVEVVRKCFSSFRQPDAIRQAA